MVKYTLCTYACVNSNNVCVRVQISLINVCLIKKYFVRASVCHDKDSNLMDAVLCFILKCSNVTIRL